MAKQCGIIKLTGTIGGITFYKTKDGYFARTKGGVTGERFRTGGRGSLIRYPGRIISRRYRPAYRHGYDSDAHV